MNLSTGMGRDVSARYFATVRLHVLAANLDQLDEIIERIADEEPGAVLDRLRDSDIVAVFLETGLVGFDVVDFETEMLLRRVRPELLFFKDMDFIAVVVGGKPDHGHRGETFGLLDFAHAEDIAVERASVLVAAWWHGDAGVLQSLDRGHAGSFRRYSFRLFPHSRSFMSSRRAIVALVGQPPQHDDAVRAGRRTGERHGDRF